MWAHRMCAAAGVSRKMTKPGSPPSFFNPYPKNHARVGVENDDLAEIGYFNPENCYWAEMPPCPLKMESAQSIKTGFSG